MTLTEKRILQRGSGWVLLLGLGIYGSAIGQSTDALNVELSQCIGLDSDEERFACYQERVEAALAERNSSAAAKPEDRAGAPSTIAAPARIPGPQPSAVADVPVSSDVSTIGAVPNQPDKRATDEIFGTITALRETIPDVWTITLDNGQVWQMNQAKRYPLRVGLKVRLDSTRWGGSYRLTALEHGGFVQVRRAF